MIEQTEFEKFIKDRNKNHIHPEKCEGVCEYCWAKEAWIAQQQKIDLLQKEIEIYKSGHDALYVASEKQHSLYILTENTVFEVVSKYNNIVQEKNDFKVKLDRAMECLKFYADKDNWIRPSMGYCSALNILKDDDEKLPQSFAPIDNAPSSISGKRARECLKELGEG